MIPSNPSTTGATPSFAQDRGHSTGEATDPRPASLAQAALASSGSECRLSPSGSSLSLGTGASPRTPPLRDALNNPNVASHFETAVSLAVVESRGPGAREVNRVARHLATAFRNLARYQDVPISDKNGHPTTLGQVFEKGILKTTAPAAPGTEDSAFLGRCIDSPKELHNCADWTSLGGLQWLINQLEMDCTSESYNHNNLLVKIKAFADFGELLTDLIQTENPTSKTDSSLAFHLSLGREVPTMTEDNIKTMSLFSHALGYEDVGHFLTAFSTIKGLTRNTAFNTLREREERVPYLGDGSSLTHKQHLHTETKHPMGRGVLIKDEVYPIEYPLMPRPKASGGCGNVYSVDSIHPWDQLKNPELADKVAQALTEAKRTKKYEGAPVTDTGRPGFLADDAYASPPPGFEYVKEEADAMPYRRSLGVNIWKVDAGFSEMCLQSGLPVVGAHSGTTADIMIACELLGREQLNETQTNLLSVMIHAYMAYGACHSMAEVFSVVDAVRDGTQFTPRKGLPEFIKFYQDYMHRARLAIGEEESEVSAAAARTESSESLTASTTSEAVEKTASSDDLSRATSPLSTGSAAPRTASSISLGALTPRGRLERAHSSFRVFCTPEIVREILASGETLSITSRESKEEKARRIADAVAFAARVAAAATAALPTT